MVREGVPSCWCGDLNGDTDKDSCWVFNHCPKSRSDAPFGKVCTQNYGENKYIHTLMSKLAVTESGGGIEKLKHERAPKFSPNTH